MSIQPHIDHALIAQIEDFLAKSGMTPTAFGREVANDGTLLADLREGRELRRKTRDKLLSFIAEQSSGSALGSKKGALPTRAVASLKGLSASNGCSLRSKRGVKADVVQS